MYNDKDSYIFVPLYKGYLSFFSEPLYKCYLSIKDSLNGFYRQV